MWKKWLDTRSIEPDPSEVSEAVPGVTAFGQPLLWHGGLMMMARRKKRSGANISLTFNNKMFAFIIPALAMFLIYEIAFTDQKMGRASAFSVVSFAVIIAITIVMLIFMNKREVEV